MSKVKNKFFKTIYLLINLLINDDQILIKYKN